MTAIASRRFTESKDSLLRFAMRLDAIVVGVLGIALVAAAGAISTLTGIPKPTDYVIGIGSIVYGLVVYGLAALSSVRAAGIGTVIANFVGAVFTVVVVLADLAPLTTAGIVVVLATGVYMALIAELQYQGVRRI